VPTLGWRFVSGTRPTGAPASTTAPC
jgi:hypothetical protein